jgi:hypothetical protein
VYCPVLLETAEAEPLLTVTPDTADPLEAFVTLPEIAPVAAGVGVGVGVGVGLGVGVGVGLGLGDASVPKAKFMVAVCPAVSVTLCETVAYPVAEAETD